MNDPVVHTHHAGTPDGAALSAAMTGDDENTLAAQRSHLGDALRAIRESMSVATVFRLLGSSAMVASISVFLMQGFDAQNDLTRFATLLGQSVLLTLAGLLVGFALREPKGARVFLTLALVSVPANVAILAAMVYSLVPWDGGLTLERYPEFARWQAADSKDLWIGLSAGLALLLPVTILALRVLTRRLAAPLSLALLAGSCLLLVPVREPGPVAVMAGLYVLGSTVILARVYRRQGLSLRFMTFEEKLANALILIAPGILIGRSLIVHGISDVSSLVFTVLGYCVLYRLARLARHTVKRQFVLVILAVIAALCSVGWAMLVWDQNGGPGLAVAPGSVALLALMLYPLAARSESVVVTRLVEAVWVGFTLLIAAVWGLLSNGVIEVVAVLSLPVSIMVLGVLTNRPGRLLIGLAAVVAILFPHVDAFAQMVLGTGWIGLAMAGVIAILAGSLWERFAPGLHWYLARRPRLINGSVAETADQPPVEPASRDQSADGGRAGGESERAAA